MLSPPRIFRVRVVLQAMDDIRMHAFHAGTLYALLAAAASRGRQAPPGIPDGLLLDAPEQCRSILEPTDRYAFGFTLLAHPDQASSLVTDVVRGLKELGKKKEAKGLVWGGNFKIIDIHDLIADRSWNEGNDLTPVPTDQFVREIEQLSDAADCTLQFGSPFRSERPNRDRLPGRGFLDRDYFPPELFARRLWERLAGLGIVTGPAPALGEWTVAENRLVWLDFSYGHAQARKRLGGVVGRIAFGKVPREWHRALVWGQYVRAGLNTRFGFGGYRIAQLGPAPYPCRRAQDLLELALRRVMLDSAAEDVPVGALNHLADQLREGSYQPAAPTLVDIPDGDGSSRRLAIPGSEDRALQRAVLHALTPGLDLFLEDASFAYRRGLGRHSAARGLAMAWSAGFRWAVRSDVHRFFDSIDHVELQARLDAYIADSPMVQALMAWVRVGAPYADRGLPTGSPLAPLLANLFLDGFDERITSEGGRLIRYADDFLILTRTREDADRLHAAAQREVAALELLLNHEKTQILNLRQPFDFLGFHFFRDERWEHSTFHPPRLIDELGWTEGSAAPDRGSRQALPAEVERPAEDEGIVIAGPGVYRVAIERNRLVCGDGAHAAGIEPDLLGGVILLGDPDIAAAVLFRLGTHGVPVFVADASLRQVALVIGDAGLENTEAIAAQLRLADNEPGRLAVARSIVAAKLNNYALLAESLPGKRETKSLSAWLRDGALQCAVVKSLDELLGVEGSAARGWYAALDARLPPGWSFPGRVAPQAEDPVNVLLNLAFTYLHRWAQLAVRAAGLLPGVGFLHRPRSGHPALASDLMEPFRPIMEGAVLELLKKLHPTDFRQTPRGRFALTILHRAYQQVLGELTRALRRGVALTPALEPRSYRRHLLSSARGLARHLVDPAVPWTPFVLPTLTPDP
jgi:CRISPR-associated protein Cas1